MNLIQGGFSMIDILFQLLLLPFEIINKITDILFSPWTPKSRGNQSQNQSRKAGEKDWDKWPPYF